MQISTESHSECGFFSWLYGDFACIFEEDILVCKRIWNTQTIAYTSMHAKKQTSMQVKTKATRTNTYDFFSTSLSSVCNLYRLMCALPCVTGRNQIIRIEGLGKQLDLICELLLFWHLFIFFSLWSFVVGLGMKVQLVVAVFTFPPTLCIIAV